MSGTRTKTFKIGLSRDEKQYFIDQLNALVENVTTDVSTNKSDINDLKTNKADKTEIPTKVSELLNDKDYAVTGDIPTKVSELSNDANYAVVGDIPTNVSQLNNDSNYATVETVKDLISNINTIEFEVVDKLPTSEISTTTIYLLNVGNDDNNLYEEYVYVQGRWELIGTTRIDLSDYATKDSIPTAISQLTNDKGFITIDSVPTKVSQLDNDKEYLNANNFKTINGETIVGEGDIETLVEPEIHTYHTSAPQTEWFRIAKVKDITKSCNGEFMFNIYGIHQHTGILEPLSADVFAASCVIKDDKFLSDVLSVAHSSKDVEGSSGGSGGISMGTGLSALRFELYKDCIYLCGLFSIAAKEFLTNIRIDMLINDNNNFEYLDTFEKVYFDNEYQNESNLLEGTKLDEDTYYAIKLKTTYKKFLDAVSNKNSYSLELLDHTGDSDKVKVIDLQFDSAAWRWEFITCSPNIDLDDQGNRKVVTLAHDYPTKYFFDPIDSDTASISGEDLNAINREPGTSEFAGNLIKTFCNNGGGTSSSTYHILTEGITNDYFTSRVTRYAFDITHSGSTANTVKLIKNGELVTYLSVNETTRLYLESPDDVIKFETENVSGIYLTVKLVLEETSVELEVPYKQGIDRYVDNITATNNDMYGFGLAYQLYYPHIISQSYITTSIYRNIVSANVSLTYDVQNLQSLVDGLEKDKLDKWYYDTIQIEGRSESDYFIEFFKTIYNDRCKTLYETDLTVYCRLVDDEHSATRDYIINVQKTINYSSYYNTTITAIDIRNNKVIKCILKSKRWNYTVSSYDITYEIVSSYYESKVVDSMFQTKLVSGTNIKTINNTDITGSGNIDVVEKNTTSYSTPIVYARGAEGTDPERAVQYSNKAYGQFLVQRDSNGYFEINDPTAANHPASKQYVDALIGTGSGGGGITGDRNTLITIIGEASESLSGIMSADDKKNLNTLTTLLGEDENTTVDKITEILAIFDKYPEGSELIQVLALKANIGEVVDLTSEQTITGKKIWNENIVRGNISGRYLTLGESNSPWDKAFITYLNSPWSGCTFGPQYTDTYDLGTSSRLWRNIYISNSITLGVTKIDIDSSERLNLYYKTEARVKIGNGETLFTSKVSPDTGNTYDLGRTGLEWKNLYLKGNITDGTNSITVADIANKNDLFSGEYKDLIDAPQECTIVLRDVITNEDAKELKQIDIDNQSWKIETESRPLKVLINENTYNQKLEPNKYYIFDSQVSQIMTLTFAPESEEYLDEYMGEIRVDDTAVEVTFPNNIRWAENSLVGIVENNHLVLTPKHTYLFSVANNLGLITGIPNPSLKSPLAILDGDIFAWEQIENADEYKVGYDINNTIGTYKEPTSINLREALKDNIAPREYKVYVIAKSKYYTDAKSNVVTFTITEQLKAPTNLTLSNNLLTWDTNVLAQEYEIYETTNNTLLGTSTITAFDLSTITNLTGTYEIKVKAINTSQPNLYLSSELSEGITYTWGTSE